MIPLILAIPAAVAALVAVFVALLNWEKVIDWFKGRTQLKVSDKDNIAFTIQEKLKDGKYETVQGIFNKSTNELLDAKKYKSEEIDDQLAKVHRREKLVFYE
jgi:hypothetical protein